MSRIRGKSLDKQMLTWLYLNEPLEFVRRELHVEPSADQAKLINSMKDLDSLYHIISSGRGGGKTQAVAMIVAWSVACLPRIYGYYDVIILSGSAEQSENLYNYFVDFCYRTPLLSDKVKGAPRRRKTTFTDAMVKAVTASQKSARGPHPCMLIIDEVCEADDNIVEAALLSLTGSRHGRAILLSTPHKAIGAFKDYWDFAEERQYTRHGPWSLTGCPWVKQEQIDLWRRTKMPDTFRVEILGEFAKSKAQVFDMEWIDKAYSHGTIGINKNYPTEWGIDWGQLHLTVLTCVQRIDGIIYICGPPHIWDYTFYPKAQSDIVAITKNVRTVAVSCDSSHKGENQRLDAEGLPVNEVVFGNSKAQLVEMLVMLMFKGRVRISNDLHLLKQQLRKYSRKSIQGVERFSKVDDDCIDSLLCALYPLMTDGDFGEAPMITDKFDSF